MKNIILLLTIVFLTSGICSCRSKKSATELKQTETENVSVTDNSTVAKTETAEENTISRTSSKWSDKSLFEAWMEIKSDEATFEDKSGNKWTFKNPQVNQKSSQTNDIGKTEQTDIKKEKLAIAEENQQNNVAASNSRQIKTDLQKTSSKGKEPLWLYVVGAVLVGGFGYLILKRFGLV
ncbi:hypothetical protein SAMN05421741_11813 [Paenimyroides ummariense]|uniref:Lipoprotein n=1 Tax=Paenimyroides ummariense TaxID=913024 RepID=A0A1I5DZ01_9FLAO|nr:hypothetical protein [Paenimyroides ummariense]SFO04468.1 hypothetical protein SAMN05421741_11813 [Paenimyroides ummariense]